MNMVSRPNLPSLRTLQAFEAAARWQSFSEAAKELNVTHAAVSHHVRTIEKQYKVTLFSRTNASLELTEAGAQLYGDLHESFEKIALAAHKLENPDTQKRLTLCVDPDFAELWLAPRMGRFMFYHPETELEIDTSRLPVDVEESRFDGAIYYGSPEDPGRRTDVLRTIRAFPVCHARRQRQVPALRSPDDLSRVTLIHEKTTDWWRHWLEAAGARQVDATRGHVFPSTTLCFNAAIATDGIAVGDDLLAAKYLEDNVLWRPFDLSLPCPHSYCLLLSRASSKRPAVAAFRTWLIREAAAEQRQSEAALRGSQG
jgi:LysR family glycine cleavage system transcriptional activator